MHILLIHSDFGSRAGVISYQQLSMGIAGRQRMSRGYLRPWLAPVSLEVTGYRRETTDISGYQRASTCINGHRPDSVDINGYQGVAMGIDGDQRMSTDIIYHRHWLIEASVYLSIPINGCQWISTGVQRISTEGLNRYQQVIGPGPRPWAHAHVSRSQSFGP